MGDSWTSLNWGVLIKFWQDSLYVTAGNLKDFWPDHGSAGSVVRNLLAIITHFPVGWDFIPNLDKTRKYATSSLNFSHVGVIVRSETV